MPALRKRIIVCIFHYHFHTLVFALTSFGHLLLFLNVKFLPVNIDEGKITLNWPYFDIKDIDGCGCLGIYHLPTSSTEVLPHNFCFVHSQFKL